MPGEFYGQRSHTGYSPWGCKESDMTEQLTHTHTHTHCKHDLVACYVPDTVIVAGYKVIKKKATKNCSSLSEIHSFEIFNDTATIHNTV